MTLLVRLVDATRGAAMYAGVAEIVGDQRPVRRVDYYEVMIVVAGEGWHVLSSATRRGSREPLRAGDMLFLRPTDIHQFGARDGRVSLIVIDFPIASWHILMSLSGLDGTWFASPDVPRARYDPGDPEALGPFHAAIEAAARGATEFDLLRFWADVIPAFVAAARIGRGAGLPRWLADALDLMRDEANLRGGVHRLRDLSHVSAAHLSRSVRSALGMTPTALIDELRLRHAATLLATTRDSVGTIAARCGFSDPSYFGARFRTTYSLTPTGYRREFGKLSG